MKLSMMNEMLSTLDPKIVYICIAVLAVLALITLIKKAFVMAAIIAIIAVGAYAIVPIAKDFQENFSISINDENQLVIVAEGNEFILGGEEQIIKKIEIERQQSGDYLMKVFYGDQSSVGIFTVPSYMRDTLLKFINKMEYQYTLFE